MKRIVRRQGFHLIIAFLAGLVSVGIYSHLTNPFVHFSIVRDPYIVNVSDAHNLRLQKTYEPVVKSGWLAGRLAFIKSGWHIAANRFTRSPAEGSYDIETVIHRIHTERFDPHKPFIISGDHFSVLYPRSLGIFYHTALDPRTAYSREDWLNRQAAYLKTTAYALEVYGQTPELSTTIVPLSAQTVTLMNIYAQPSDTLYSLFYALQILQSSDSLQKTYPFTVTTQLYELSTASAAAQLIKDHHVDLARHYQRYMTSVYDRTTGLVKKDMRLSGTKDMAIRSSAFYDNVMVWATTQLAQQLHIIPNGTTFLDDYKKRILTSFWNETDGYFAEDLGEYAHAYSSDWIIAYQTGFLSPENQSERKMLIKAVSYIKKNGVDRPFGLKYHTDRRPSQLYTTVRLFAPDYGSRAIWSHWGMEYMKLLAHLAQVTHDKDFAQEARYQLIAYENNIKKYGGYPEVYDSDGHFFKQRMYESVLQTGWVVNFEEARAMVKSLPNAN